MKKIGFSSMNSLEQLKTLSGSVAGGGVAKNLTFSSRPSSDSISYGSFANLKLTAGFDREIFVIFCVIL